MSSNEGLANHRALNGGAPKGWRAVQPISIEVKNDPGPVPALYAVVSTWNDADVVHATVRNCLDQGCSRVYILDNGSQDDTKLQATLAGCANIMVYETKFYDDDLRVTLQNQIVKSVTEKEKLPDLWWMVLDADEFPTGRGGRTVLQWLTGLPQKIRVVGSDFIDLYPTDCHHHCPDEHPASCMEMGMWRRGGIHRYCQCGHWKHLLVRHLNGCVDLAHNRGNHTVTAAAGGAATIGEERARGGHGVHEPQFDVPVFHAPIRGREATFARLRLLCDTGRCSWDDQVTGGNGAVKRWRSLEDVYAGRWDRVEIPHTQMYGRPVKGVALYPWKTLLEPKRCVPLSSV